MCFGVFRRIATNDWLCILLPFWDVGRSRLSCTGIAEPHFGKSCDSTSFFHKKERCQMIQEFTETMLNNVLKELIYVWKKEIYFYSISFL